MNNNDFLNEIEQKVTDGARLTQEDALRLYQTNDLIAVGALADRSNRRINGDRIFYNVNHHINPTNLCVLDCDFCSFSAKPGQPHAYKLNFEEILAKVTKATAAGITEVHIVGGLEPGCSYEEYRDLLANLHDQFPQLHLKAFTVVEIDYFARITKKPVETILEELKQAGLGSLPGGGAEIFSPRVRKILCKSKLSGERWLELHQIAHGQGIRSNATMLYGHIETLEERIDHMDHIRSLQDQTGGFNVFIPLAFQPENNRVKIDHPTTGMDDLMTLSISRLFLDNFSNLKAYWVMLTPAVAQLSLHFGVNDLDGTVLEERIAMMAGGKTAGRMAREQLEEIIQGAGKIPVQRDTLYRIVREVA